MDTVVGSPLTLLFFDIGIAMMFVAMFFERRYRKKAFQDKDVSMLTLVISPVIVICFLALLITASTNGFKGTKSIIHLLKTISGIGGWAYFIYWFFIKRKRNATNN